MPTPWRVMLYKKISRLELTGRILDLGGSRKSGYHQLIGGRHDIDVANIYPAAGGNYSFDLEQSFPLHDRSYETVMLINVLEHIYDYANVIRESYRIIKPEGLFIVGVPFLIQIHPSPRDHWRYSGETLRRLLDSAGFKEIVIQPLGAGPFTACAQILNNALQFSVFRVIAATIAAFFDSCVSVFRSKAKLAEEYPLGYFVTAKK